MRRLVGLGILLGTLIAAFALPGRAAASGASPSSIAFGNVPLNTTVTRDVTITADAGFQIQLASGSGINPPFVFDFDTCGAGGGFSGPGTCNVKQRFRPTALTASSGTTNVFECPIAGRSCIAIPYSVSGTRLSVASAIPSAIAFGNLPFITPVTRHRALPAFPTRRSSDLSGSGINPPFVFDFDTCGAGGGFSGPGTCNVKQRFTPTALAASSGTTNVFEC